MNAVFLHSLPDQYGYIIEDLIFQNSDNNIPRQTEPTIQPVVGRYFGKKGNHLYEANIVTISVVLTQPAATQSNPETWRNSFRERSHELLTQQGWQALHYFLCQPCLEPRATQMPKGPTLNSS